MSLQEVTGLISAIFTAVSAMSLFTASLLLPLLYKKFASRQAKLEEGERALIDAFDKYFSSEYPKNDFEWYFAQIQAVIKRFDVRNFRCINCKKRSSPEKYMEYFKSVDKIIPEINNFSFRTENTKYQNTMSVLTCYKCNGENQYKIDQK